MIIFDAEKHTYTDFFGKQYTSVTTLIKRYEPEYDPGDEKKKAESKKTGESIEDIAARWKSSGDVAKTKGTAAHWSLERFIHTGEIKTNWDLHFSKIVPEGILLPEIRIYNTNLLVCGTADLVSLLPRKRFRTFDYKSNKRIRSENVDGIMMLAPFNHLPVCEITTYSLQMSIYRYMLEQTGLEGVDQTIYHLDSKVNQIKTIPVPYLKEEAIMMLAA